MRPRQHGHVSRAVATIMALALLASACGAGPVTSPAGSDGPPVDPTAKTTDTSPAPTRVAATATAGPSRAATEPPTASLAAEGGDPVDGQLGSYAWLDRGSDSPWLPGSPVAVGAGEPMTVTIGDGIAVVDWSARRIPAGTMDATGAVALGSGGPRVAFAAPGPGTWSVQVDVRFGDDLGSAAYYWQLTVR